MKVLKPLDPIAYFRILKFSIFSIIFMGLFSVHRPLAVGAFGFFLCWEVIHFIFWNRHLKKTLVGRRSPHQQLWNLSTQIDSPRSRFSKNKYPSQSIQNKIPFDKNPKTRWHEIKTHWQCLIFWPSHSDLNTTSIVYHLDLQKKFSHEEWTLIIKWSHLLRQHRLGDFAKLFSQATYPWFRLMRKIRHWVPRVRKNQPSGIERALFHLILFSLSPILHSYRGLENQLDSASQGSSVESIQRKLFQLQKNHSNDFPLELAFFLPHPYLALAGSTNPFIYIKKTNLMRTKRLNKGSLYAKPIKT